MKEKEKHKKYPYLKNVGFKLTLEEKDLTKCYCGYTTYCDCSTKEPNQETLEEAFEKWADQQFEKGIGYDKLDVLMFGAKWQQERIQNLRDELYNQLPTGEVSSFDLIKIINSHIKKIDEQFKNK